MANNGTAPPTFYERAEKTVLRIVCVILVIGGVLVVGHVTFANDEMLKDTTKKTFVVRVIEIAALPWMPVAIIVICIWIVLNCCICIEIMDDESSEAVEIPERNIEHCIITM